MSNELQKSRGIWADDFIGTLLDKDAIVYYLEEGFDPGLLPKEEARAIWHFVREYFESSKDQTPPPLDVLTTEFPTWRFVEPQAEPHWILKHLKEQWQLKESRAILNSALRLEPDEVYPFLKEKVFEMDTVLETDRNHFSTKELSSMFDKYLAAHEAGDLIGVTSGFPEIDAVTGGFRSSQLIVINGRLKVGKTWFGLVAFLAQRLQGVNPMFITMELSPDEVYQRMIALMSGVSFNDIWQNQLTPGDMAKLQKAIKAEEALPIGHVVQPAPGYRRVPDLLTFVDKYKCGSLIVDQLENLENREARSDRRHDLNVGALAEDLKLAAQRPGREMPVYAMHQFSRQQTKDGELDVTNMANSDIVARVADTVYGLQQTNEMYESNQIKIELMEGRSNRKKISWICDFEFTERTRVAVGEEKKSDFDQAVETLTILQDGRTVNPETGELVGSIETT